MAVKFTKNSEESCYFALGVSGMIIVFLEFVLVLLF